METPSSIQRVTRSQTLSASKNIPLSRTKEEPENVLSRSRKGKSDRSVLFDITNDSPIVGLAMGSVETPSSVAKSRGPSKQTPGMGEALLRGQVKTLLQKVEEDADLTKPSFDQTPFPRFQGLLTHLAPTPANTPFMLNGNAGTEINGLPIVMPVSNEEQDPKTTQATEGLQQTTLESHESLINRALLFDSPGKSEISDDSTLSSGLTFQGSCCDVKPDAEDDDASVWSVQVNASSPGEDKIGEVEEYEETEVDDYEHEIEEVEDDGGLIDELCEVLKNVCVQEKAGMPEFKGRHTRFLYNSDDEIEGEEGVREGSSVSPSILRLKGMPMPEGKHLRFPEEEE